MHQAVSLRRGCRLNVRLVTQLLPGAQLLHIGLPRCLAGVGNNPCYGFGGHA